MSKNKLFLLDAMALIYRAHFAFSKNPRINSKGMNTGAVLGFTNTLLDVLKKEKPSHIGVAFDTAQPTFRHEEFKEYKANRDVQPEDITTAIPYIYKMVEAFNIPILVKPGFEADDIIGTIAKRAARTGEFQVYMMTPDKDYAQLVEDDIFLFKPAFLGNSVSVWGIPEVLEKFDIERVEQVIDLLGLQGDASDNIPGIPGVGAKTAVKFLKAYGSVEGLLENVDKLKGKQKEKVIEFGEQGLLSKRLATIITDVDIPFDPDALKESPLDRDQIISLFDELEFRTLKKRLFPDTAPATKASPSSGAAPSGQQKLFETPSPESSGQTAIATPSIKTIRNTIHHYHLLEDAPQIDRLVHLLLAQKEFCFDTETSSLNPLDAALVGIAFATYPGEAYYIPFPNHPSDQIPQEVKALLEKLKPAFESPNIIKIAQNIKYDLAVLKNYGVEIQSPLFDTMLAHYLIEPDKRHNMDALAESYLQYKPVSIESLIGKKGAKQGNMQDLKPQEILEYAGEDADITWQLKQKLAPFLDTPDAPSHPALDPESPEYLRQAWNLRRVHDEVETPLVPVLAGMEHEGIRVDASTLEEISSELLTGLQGLSLRIFELAGAEFNIASPKQLGEILFDKLKLVDKPKKTKTGQYATGEEILIRLADEHEIVARVLEYRETEKLKNTYVDALPGLIHPKTGHIHTSYNQAVAATGRLSSANPNLQNIPIRTQRGRAIRRAFVPRNEDYVLLSADYSQIELRIMAAFSQDETMMQAFRAGADIHATTAAKLYKVELEAVESLMRSKAKTANFGIIYGISAHGLSQRLNIARKEAGEIINSYFEEFPAIKAYMDQVVQDAREKEYVETILGRRRYLRNINSRNNVERGNAERNAINAPIQGSAADMIKLAMIHIDRFIQEKNLKSRMILQVHDELVFDAHRDELDILRPAVEELMKNALPLIVPMAIGMGEGENWLEAH